jgi:hypothetical protein
MEDESATMGANLALASSGVTMGANLAPRWVLKKIGCRCRPTRRLSFNLGYARLGFNGLLFIWGAFKRK